MESRSSAMMAKKRAGDSFEPVPRSSSCLRTVRSQHIEEHDKDYDHPENASKNTGALPIPTTLGSHDRSAGRFCDWLIELAFWLAHESACRCSALWTGVRGRWKFGTALQTRYRRHLVAPFLKHKPRNVALQLFTDCHGRAAPLICPQSAVSANPEFLSMWKVMPNSSDARSPWEDVSPRLQRFQVSGWR